MSVMEPVAGHTYRVIDEHGVEQAHINVSRVKGRKIETKVTPWSALLFQDTRLRWRKRMELLQRMGCTITEEPTP